MVLSCDGSWKGGVPILFGVAVRYRLYSICRCSGCSTGRVTGHKICRSAGSELTSLFLGSQECVCWHCRHQPLDCLVVVHEGETQVFPPLVGDHACGGDPSRSLVFWTYRPWLWSMLHFAELAPTCQCLAEVGVTDDGCLLHEWAQHPQKPVAVSRIGGGGTYVVLVPSAPTHKSKQDCHLRTDCDQVYYGSGEPASAKKLMHIATCSFNRFGQESQKDTN